MKEFDSKASTISLALALAAAAPLSAGAQGRGKPRGTIQEAEIEVVKDRVNTLPEATRNYQPVPVPAPPPARRALTLTYPDFRLPATRLAPAVQLLPIAAEELEPLTGNYLRLGGGNYGTLYGRAHLHSTRNERYSYGLDLRHQSSASGPVDGANSAVAQTSVAATGEYYLGQTALGASLDYARERYHFYGYQPELLTATPSAEAIQQTFNRFGLRGYARNRAPDAALTYEAGVGYQYWQDAFTSDESNFLLDGKLGYKLGATSRLTLQANASFITEHEDILVTSGFTRAQTRSRTFVQATPAYELRTQAGLSLLLGATLGYSSEPLENGPNPGGVGKGNVNPAVRVGYAVVPEKFSVYAGAGGAIQRVTRYGLTQENPWLGNGSGQAVADTHSGPAGYLGFTAAPAGGLELAARATYGRTRNLYFFNNVPSDYGQPLPLATGSTYALVYDSAAVNVLTVHGELLYRPAGERWRTGLKADYNHYGVRSLAHPYGRPAFVSTLYATYNASDKLLLGTDFYYYSPNWGTAYASGPVILPYPTPVGTANATPQQTTAVIDLSLRAEYRVTPKFSIFALGNNLANRRYQRFLYYPVKGINVIGGLAYAF